MLSHGHAQCLIEVRTDSGFAKEDLLALKLAVGALQRQVSWRFVVQDLTRPLGVADRLALTLAAVERLLAGRGLAPSWPQADDSDWNAAQSKEAPHVVLAFQSASDALPANVPINSHLITVCWQDTGSSAMVGLKAVLRQAATACAQVSVFAPGGQLLGRRRLAVPTQFTFAWTHDLLVSKAMALAGNVVGQLIQGRELALDFLGAEPRERDGREQFSCPGFKGLLDYGGRMMARVAANAARRITKDYKTWHIELSRGGWQAHLQGARTVVPNPPGRFWADPFVCHHQGRDILFVEDYEFATGSAHISALEIDADGVVHDLGPCLTEDYHLSYPFVFEWEGQLYMCPETFAAGQIRVYRCDEFPLKWSLAAVLMDKVSAADTSLFFHEDRWWMLTNIDSAGGSEHCTELHVFWADHPLSTNWTPHPGNPVVCDASRGRNGGLIIDGQEILRVNQVQRYSVYGAALAVNELSVLSPTAFFEHVVVKFDPQALGSGQIGAHHLSSNGRWSVSDHLLHEPLICPRHVPDKKINQVHPRQIGHRLLPQNARQGSTGEHHPSLDGEPARG